MKQQDIEGPFSQARGKESEVTRLKYRIQFLECKMLGPEFWIGMISGSGFVTALIYEWHRTWPPSRTRGIR